ncbi:hypothetical protein [Hymenobacter sp. YC55]|uniref:hypothetical protein n=1 Tax=Hymenobacter sp. YC55 TaxID=3034019 RepID=UPI0023F63EBC|nr:hypothetical protein [Hymenobacter sp. YC55]MDF7815269.1 hypothetical protein [Hymenobacter sp. YC55]
MSTRATYLFIGEAPAPAATTLYLQLDGDAQGAARYLRAMLRAGEGVSAVAFIRANTQSSLVSGHDVYSNTSFRYTLTEDMCLLAEERLVDFEEGWKTIFAGPLVDFINSQPGEMLHAVALYEYGPVGFYTQYQLGVFAGDAMKHVMELEQQAATAEAQAFAKERVKELKAIHLAAFRLEEFGEAVAA